MNKKVTNAHGRDTSKQGGVMKEWIRNNMKWIIIVVAILLVVIISMMLSDSTAIKQWMAKPLSDATVGDVALIAFGVVLFVK